RARPLLGLAHLHLLGGHELGNPAARIVEIAGDDRALGADDHARGLEADLETVSAVVALGGGLGGGIDVERVVGAGLHARLAADTALAVEVHDGERCIGDRKSTRLNSSHVSISYAVFCLKKKKYKLSWYTPSAM